MEELIITCPSFEDHGLIPKKHTGFGEDASPGFHIGNLSPEAVSIAILMDDLDIPFVPAYNHWAIWNVPRTERIPEGVPYGPSVPSLGGAIQGVAYGRHRYRGPKQPFFIRSAHDYIFRFYALDSFLTLDASAGKRDVERAMRAHIIQRGAITGSYRR